MFKNGSRDVHEAMTALVKDINGKHFPGPHWKTGDVVRHPDGRSVRILSGKYWSDPVNKTGLSNFWSFEPVDEHGVAVGPAENGYGWDPSRFEDAQ